MGHAGCGALPGKLLRGIPAPLPAKAFPKANQEPTERAAQAARPLSQVGWS